MCCRYSYGIRMADELLEKLGIESAEDMPCGEIGPAAASLIVRGEGGILRADKALWGFPAGSGGLMINARAETVLQKPMFSSSALYRRCVMPASRFWEWDEHKKRVGFEDPENEMMLLAGIWDLKDGAARFVVLTTEANDTVRPVHERMPLLLGMSEAEGWIKDLKAAERLMKKPMPPLRQLREQEQLRMF